MKKGSLFTLVLAVSILFLSSFALAAPSKVIPLQGKLTQTNGVPYSGTYSMTFNIYNVATSGTSLYTETISNVPVSAGLFSIILGESTPIPLAFDQDYYIEITIGSETLAPRQKLLSSPYAIYSQNSSYAVNSQNAVSAQSAVTAQTATSATNVIGGSVSANNVGIVRNNDALSIQALDNSASYGGIIFYNNTGGRTGGIRSHTSTVQSGLENDLELWSESGDVYVSKGNVGIGTATPQKTLDVAGSLRTGYNIYGSTGQIGFFTDSNGALPIKAGSLTISDTYTDNAPANGLFVKGNVGIGTNNPSQALDVVGNGVFRSSTDSNHAITLYNNPRDKTWNIYQLNSTDTTPNGFLLEYYNGSAFNRAFTITQSGNVGIGTATPSNKLHVAGSIGATDWVGAGCETNCEVSGGYAILYPNGNIVATGNASLGGNVKAAKVLAYTGTNPNLKADYDIAGGQIGSETTYAYNAICVGNQNGDCTGTGGTVIKPNTATFGGNVGIGTTSPGEKLDVAGSIQTTGTGGNGGRIILKSTAQGGHQYEIYSDTPSTGDLGFFDRTTNNNRLVIKSDGNVGIGRTPTQKLDIAGNIAFDGGILSGANSANFLTYTGSAALPIKTGGVTISDTYTDNAPANGLFVKGNVGIGTSTPSEKLDVAGNVKATGVCIGSDCRTSWPSGATSASDNTFSGAIAFFGSNTCPSGWQEYAPLRGRYAVGLQQGGTIGSTIGTALSNQENRPTGQHVVAINDQGHSHTAYVANFGYNGGGYGVAIPNVNSAWNTGIYTNTLTSTTGITASAGSVAGTNAPYIQLIACQRTSPIETAGIGSGVPHACTVRTNSISNNNNVNVNCAAGEMATGGGGACSENIQLRYARPNVGSGTPTGWEVYYLSGCATVSAYAVCCQV